MIRLISIIIIHALVVIGNLYGFIFLSYHGFENLFGLSDYIHWTICLSACTTIFWVSTTREECYLTRLENRLRRRLGLTEIKGFIKHYFLRRFW
jgi:hypothetical protein